MASCPGQNFFAKDSLMTTTDAPFFASSSVKLRPRTNAVPMVLKKSGDTAHWVTFATFCGTCPSTRTDWALVGRAYQTLPSATDFTPGSVLIRFSTGGQKS